MAGITGTNGNRQVGQDLYKDKYQRWMTGFPTEAGPGTGMPNPAGTHYLTKENIRGGYGDTVKDGMYVGHEDPWGGSELGTIVPEPPAPAGHDIAEDDLEYDSMREQPDVTESRQPVQEEAPASQFPQRFSEEEEQQYSQFQEQPTQEQMMPPKKIRTIPDLLDDQDALRRYSDEERRIQHMMLNKISPSYKGGSPEVQEMIRNKVEASLVPEWSEIPAKALSNFFPDTIKMGRDIWNAVKQPGVTAEALQATLLGAFAKLIPGDQEGKRIPFIGSRISERGAEALFNFFKERYGPVGDDWFGGLKRTMAETPSQFLGDLSIALSGGSTALMKAGLVRSGQVLADVAPFVDPIIATGKGVIKTGKSLKAKAVTGTKTALSPKKAKNVSEMRALELADEAGIEMLNNNFKINRKTTDIINNKFILPLRKKINNIISKGDEAGIPVRTKDTLRLVDDLIDDLSSIKTNPFEAELVTLRKIRATAADSGGSLGGRLDEIVQSKTRLTGDTEIGTVGRINKNLQATVNQNNKKLNGVLSNAERNRLVRENEVIAILKKKITNTGTRVGPKGKGITQSQLDKIVESVKKEEGIMKFSEAQRLKQKLNKVFLPNATATVDAMAKVAKDKVRSATKQLMEYHFPELKKLNDKQGVMIELQEAIAARIREIENTKPGASGLAIGMGTGGVVSLVYGAEPLTALGGGLGGAFMVYAADKILRSPNVRLALARATNFAADTAQVVGEGTAKFSRPARVAGGGAELSKQEQAEIDSQLGQ